MTIKPEDDTELGTPEDELEDEEYWAAMLRDMEENEERMDYDNEPE